MYFCGPGSRAVFLDSDKIWLSIVIPVGDCKFKIPADLMESSRNLESKSFRIVIVQHVNLSRMGASSTFFDCYNAPHGFLLFQLLNVAVSFKVCPGLGFPILSRV